MADLPPAAAGALLNSHSLDVKMCTYIELAACQRRPYVHAGPGYRIDLRHPSHREYFSKLLSQLCQLALLIAAGISKSSRWLSKETPPLKIDGAAARIS